MALLPGAGWVVLCFRHSLCDDVLRPLPCSSVCGLHCTGPTNARQSQWENVMSCAGGQVFLVRLGGASSAMRAVHVAAGCSVKEGSSISVSFWLRMPWSRGCWLSVTKRSVMCPLGLGALVLSPPYLLCEELAVILVDGCGCGARAHPCEASVSGLLSLGSSQPSTGSVGGGAGPGLTRFCSAWIYHCFRLGAWSLGFASSSVACHPSPSHGLARLGGFVYVSTF